MHGEFLRLLFLQVHRETEAHFTAAGMSSQNTNSEALRFKRAAFYNGLKSKVGLAAPRQRINLGYAWSDSHTVGLPPNPPPCFALPAL
jgi:hypothetical protein